MRMFEGLLLFVLVALPVALVLLAADQFSPKPVCPLDPSPFLKLFCELG
tara:strand:- start:6646 stop:6792 length:147 start_codon:yes stop_codon:yes gene_type:complete